MKYFKFVDGAIAFDNEAIALYPNIKKIISRDRGGKVSGDPDGRYKKYAFKEFTYVYFRCDYEAYPAQHGMTEQEAHEYAAKQAGLGKDYKPDELVLAFMKQYEIEHLSPAKQAIKTLIRVFAFNNKLIEKIEKVLNETLALPTLSAIQTKELFDYQKQLLEVAERVPESVKKLKAAMNLLEEEERTQEILRGGEIKLDSMDPGNSIEKND